jgi:hypothetical protein
MAEIPLESLLGLMAKFGIPAADMDAHELADELREFL